MPFIDHVGTKTRQVSVFTRTARTPRTLTRLDREGDEVGGWGRSQASGAHAHRALECDLDRDRIVAQKERAETVGARGGVEHRGWQDERAVVGAARIVDYGAGVFVVPAKENISGAVGQEALDRSLQDDFERAGYAEPVGRALTVLDA